MSERADVPVEERETKPFLDHLEDLRQMLIRCILALALGMLVVAPFTPKILALLKAPLLSVADADRLLPSLEVVGAFSVTMRIIFWSGLVVSAPSLLFFVGSFIFPGLTVRERSAVLRACGFAVILFIVGVFVCYHTTLGIALGLMARWHAWLGIEIFWTVTSYVAFATQLLIAFGLAFELPVLVLLLANLGILKSDQLRSKRRHVIVLMLFIAMILTPPDVLTQLIMALPLILLYECCIWIVWFTEKRARGARSQR